MMSAEPDRCQLGPNSDLIGVPGSRALLDTPCLLVDLALLKNNVATGASLAAAAGKRLRPHLKAHKCSKIAALQKAAGSHGFCVATVGEAETFAALGFGDLLITSTYASSRKIQRVVKLIEEGARIITVLDDLDFCNALAEAASAKHVTAPVMIDLDMGRGRAGCTTPHEVRLVSEQILQKRSLQLVGLQAYAGQLSHMENFQKRSEGALSAHRFMSQALGAIDDLCDQPLVVSGGSTGACILDADDSAIINELQWGSYVLMDVEYLAVDYCGKAGEDGHWPFSPALFVAADVISAKSTNHVTIDAGHKRLSTNKATKVFVSRGASSSAACWPTSDEHGLVTEKLPRGSKVEVVVPHVDPTIDRFDQVHVVKDDILIDIWPIEARGAF